MNKNTNYLEVPVGNMEITESTWAILALTRFFLAIIVMVSLGHLNNFANVEGILNYISCFGGKTAVMVFLIISGISVGYSYVNKKKGFLKRRFLRIYPLYFVALLGTVFLQYYLGSPYSVRNMTFVAAGNLTSIGNLLLLQGIVVLDIFYNYPVWSLSVEVFLYMMLPFIFNLRLRYIYLITFISLTVYIFYSHFSSISLFGIQHVMYAWPFILGFLIAVKKQFLGIIPLILIGAYGIYFNYTMGLVFEKYSFICFFVAVYIILSFMYFEFNLSNRSKFLFNFLGDISYPMYLFHIPMYFLFYHFGIRESYMFVCLVILLSIPINYVFDVWLKRFFWKPMVIYFSQIFNKMREQAKAKLFYD